MKSVNNSEEVAQIYSGLQSEICRVLEQADGQAVFEKDQWVKEIGYGTTCVIRNGDVIEKGGVNFSFVSGEFTPQMELLLGEKAESFAATGISSIMHPLNPFMPVIHMNVRYFSLDNGTRWFGGGIDLTPHYINAAEAGNFHRNLKNICDRYSPGYYPKFKKWADDYFFMPHRNETRGVGGIFFDRLKPDDTISFEQLLALTKDLAQLYPLIYRDILAGSKTKNYSETQKAWQELRRGRYAEFNLVYDRGTKFGFES
jgi:coproporphyrinogen III oxidase